MISGDIENMHKSKLNDICFTKSSILIIINLIKQFHFKFNKTEKWNIEI